MGQRGSCRQGGEPRQLSCKSLRGGRGSGALRFAGVFCFFVGGGAWRGEGEGGGCKNVFFLGLGGELFRVGRLGGWYKKYMTHNDHVSRFFGERRKRMEGKNGPMLAIVGYVLVGKLFVLFERCFSCTTQVSSTKLFAFRTSFARLSRYTCGSIA